MNSSEIIKKIRELEIRTNREVDEVIGGAYHSVFQGRGIEFDEVREYTSDDDSRDIDWNVTARMNAPYVKKYTEERELTVMLLVDISGSQFFGSCGVTKRESVIEAAAMLTFSAIRNHDKVGLMLFSDQVELYLPPRSGRKHALRLLREVLAHENNSLQTNIDRALKECRNLLKKRSVVFLLSDLMAEVDSFEVALRLLNRRHDVVALRSFDPAERNLPSLQAVNFEDLENGEVFYASGGNAEAADFVLVAEACRMERQQLCRRCGVDLIELNTLESPLKAMVNFFRQRRRRRR